MRSEAAAALLLAAFAAGDSAAQRARMVAEQIEARGISDPRVLAAMRKVPREEFVPAELRSLAWADRPLPIGEGQTISQPYVVALMSELLGVRGGSRILEIGTGSGYQAAVLAEMGAEVWSIEIVESPALKEQLGSAGRLVLPLRRELVVVTRTPQGFTTRSVVPVAFVPMTGEAQGK